MPDNPSETSDVERDKLVEKAGKLVKVHGKMLNAVRRGRPYPVSIEIGQSDLDAVLYGAVALEEAAAAISAMATHEVHTPVTEEMIFAGRKAAMVNKLGGPTDEALCAIYLAMRSVSASRDDEQAKVIEGLREALLTARDYVEDISKGIALRGTGFEETAKEDLVKIDTALSNHRDR